MYKAIDKWFIGYLKRRSRPPESGIIHLIIAVCDHFEPFHKADRERALERLAIWRQEFPKITAEFRDSDGVAPRHTFFYPVELYDEKILSELEDICAKTGAEVEIHLHHNNDTSEGLTEKLETGKANLRRHGFLSTDENGRVVYGFIHGDWALTNSHPEGKYCGVNNEIEVLCRTGCYADFTMPSAPSPTQSKIVNCIYYAKETGKPRSIDRGRIVEADSGITDLSLNYDELLIIQGPLGLNWERRKFGIFPRIDTGDLTYANPPTPSRLRVWIKAYIHIKNRPEWIFIKLHTHGAIEPNNRMLLGEPMREFHRYLMQFCNDKSRYRFHYVSAREMTNIIVAGERGNRGNPGDYRNYKYRR